MSNFKVFFAHKTADKEIVERLLCELRNNMPNYPIKNLSSDVPQSDSWKDVAEKLIKECDALVCIVGRESHESEPIDWELTKAIENRKYVVGISLDNNFRVPNRLLECDAKILLWDLKQVSEHLGDVLVDIALFSHIDSSNLNTPPAASVWDQYNLVVQSWENLIARRQAVNSMYMGGSGAILAAMGAVVSAMEKLRTDTAAAGILVFALLGIFVCWNWNRTLLSYGTLSSAKSRIVSALEKKLPARLFDAEWRVLEGRKYVSTTYMDRQTVSVLIVLFGSIAAVALGYLLQNHCLRL